MTSDLVSAVCGSCLHCTEAHFVPDACFRCHAKFAHAPFALVTLDISATASAGSVHVRPRFGVQFFGAWDVVLRAAINESFQCDVAKEQEHV